MENKKRLPLTLIIIPLILTAVFTPVSVLADDTAEYSLSPYETLVIDENGNELIQAIFPLPPQQPVVQTMNLPDHFIAGSLNILSDVPAFDWSYGCSATSAAMLFGYYDRVGYSNMYTGPEGGGVCPLNGDTRTIP